jgi:hypothetical protein
MAISTTVHGATMTITADGLTVQNVDHLVQIIVNMPNGRDLGAVVSVADDGSLTADVPYEGGGAYMITIYEKDATVALDSWTGKIPPAIPHHR